MPKLHPHNGVPARHRRVLQALATIAILLVAEGLNMPLFGEKSAQGTKKTVQLASAPEPAQAILSPADIDSYRRAFNLQQAGQLDEADKIAASAANPLLKGVFLGERYLLEGHEPSFSELALWLSRYGDHAQARALYRLAQSRTPDDADFLTEPEAKGALKGFSLGHDKSELAGQRHWVSGFAAYRRRDMPTAAAHFKGLLNAKTELSADDRAAAAFWAYRSSSAAGDAEGAVKYLEIAAAEQPGFYSIIARQISGSRSEAAAPQADSSSMESFLARNPAKRAMALKLIGQDALAEKELNALFPGARGADRQHLIQFAQMLNLPAAQMRMAVAGNYDTASEDARYPLPHWTPTAGYRVEPALLFAIMRQESGFNPNAKSASGAQGVMQLMPATAHAMAVDARMEMSASPAASMALGQHYIERLMEIEAIDTNLIYVIGAYNAGPGKVEAWQKSVHANDDPLLFIESIPSLQTRDYVVHVMGNYWVYSEMLGGIKNGTVTALAQNHWPRYENSGKLMVAMLNRRTPAGEDE